jgi:hypothetical protein
LLNKQEFEFGSLVESIAILSYTRERNITFMSAIMALVSPENANKAVKDIRSVIFPEEKINDAIYVAKAKQMMKKLLSIDLKVKPVKISGERDFKRL